MFEEMRISPRIGGPRCLNNTHLMSKNTLLHRRDHSLPLRSSVCVHIDIYDWTGSHVVIASPVTSRQPGGTWRHLAALQRHCGLTETRLHVRPFSFGEDFGRVYEAILSPEQRDSLESVIVLRATIQ